MKKILILGGNGFVGKNLQDFFAHYSTDYQIDAPSSKELNLIDELSVRLFLKDKYYDVIIHAAICNPLRLSNGILYNELNDNLRMFFNVAERKESYGKMLYFGSGAEYDKSMPISGVNEEVFCNGIPHNDYGLAKYIIGKQIEFSENIYNLRIFGLFGKYENWRTTFISGACCKALKGLPITIRQNVFFDYLFIDDFCKIIKWFIDNKGKYRSYNITSGKKRDLVSIAQVVKKVCNSDVPIYVCKEGLANEYTADNQRLLLELKEFQFTEFEQAVSQLAKYYKDNINQIDIYSLLYQ